MRFLSDLLADGPMPAKDIFREANGAGYSMATIRRAQKALGVVAERDGFGKGGTWKWKLPAIGAQDEHLCDSPHRCSKKPIDAQENMLSIFGEFEHLCTEAGAAEEAPNPPGDDEIIEEEI
jgi:putative DNA primase/helicase